MNKITPFLMFEGRAREALDFYISVFPQSEIVSVAYNEPEGPEAERTIQLASFSLNGQMFMCIDSPINHDFTFTPAVSFYVACDSEEEITGYFEKLSAAGQVLMPLDQYPFSEKFAWVADKFGVSWQLNLAGKQ
jgi:predicted 3-demethylubiquinone-9 3-methyltransferase (glyoxalase superfamily)